MAKKTVVRIQKGNASRRRRAQDILLQITGAISTIFRRPISLFILGLAIFMILDPSNITKIIQLATTYLGTNSFTQWLTTHKDALPGGLFITGVTLGVAPQRDQWAIFLLGLVYMTVSTVTTQTAFIISLAIIGFYRTKGPARALPILLSLFWLYSKLSRGSDSQSSQPSGRMG